ncbi:hypothetical protein [Pseudaestuariivita sp.]|uniref:hypothetical protein n=1 Tax=Pseudaestuariivita sp. TaxID=2211669 RepID=UPI004059E432
MTMITTNFGAAAPRRTFRFGPAHKVLTLLERLLQTPSKRRLEKRVRRIETLRLLDDAALAARGLRRSEITAAVFEGRA